MCAPCDVLAIAVHLFLLHLTVALRWCAGSAWSSSPVWQAQALAAQAQGQRDDLFVQLEVAKVRAAREMRRWTCL